MDVDDARIKALYKVVDKIPSFIYTLCNIRQDLNEIKRAEWLDKVGEIKAGIESEQMLLFIGPYSSGKSTFVNALLGEENLLPTSDRPCTSVVTELSFTRGGGHRGKTVGIDKSEKTDDYKALVKMVDGSRGAIGDLAQYHHIELFFDVEALENWETHPLSKLQRLNVKIVDCPGYGSPYMADDDIIQEYIEKASFVFWMSPATKFGGREAERRLGNIRKNTAALIPVITMADLINDAQREQVKEDFYEHLAELFPRNKEPRFVSAIKWLEARELEKLLNPRNPKDELSKEEEKKTRQKMDKLILESGLENIFKDMVTSGQKKVVTDSKLASALFDLNVLLKDIDNRAEKEEAYWQKEAQSKGWSEDDQYKRLNEIRKNVADWIKAEADSVAGNLETAIIKKLADYIMEVNGKVESNRVSQTVADLWEEDFNRHKNTWAEHIYNKYKEYAKEYSVKLSSNDKFPAPDLSTMMADLGHVFKGVLDGMRYAGPQSTLMCGTGAALFVGMPAIGGVALIGTGLAVVAGIVGGALIIVGGVTLLPIMLDKIKGRKEQYRKEMEDKLKDYMKALDIAPFIKTILDEANEKQYEAYKLHFDTDFVSIDSSLEKSKEIKKEIADMKETISMLFPAELKKAAI